MATTLAVGLLLGQTEASLASARSNRPSPGVASRTVRSRSVQPRPAVVYTRRAESVATAWSWRINARKLLRIDPSWPAGINGNAEGGAPNTSVLAIRYPLLGLSQIGQAASHASADDFCYNGNPNRTYSTKRCINEFAAHRGNDIESYDGAGNFDVGIGQLAVVAPMNGLVESAECDSGGGNYVSIRGDDGRYYHLLHMHPGSLAVSAGARVTQGQLVGRLGGTTTNCSVNDNVHLHFEIRYPMDRKYDDPLDPFPSLRNAVAAPGLVADGTVDWKIYEFYVYVVNASGGWGPGQQAIGWSGDGGTVRAANAFSASRPNNAGTAFVQYLTKGESTFDSQFRNAAIVHRTGASTAHWVQGAIFKKWLALGAWQHYLGFPTANEGSISGGIRQNFNGGCVTVKSGVVAYARYGTATCP